MAKYKAEHLIEMIQGLVEKEVDRRVNEAIKRVVPGVIAEVLSEKYLKHLAENSAKPRGVSMNFPIQGDEEEQDEEVPHALSNSILGVGQQNPVFKKEPSGKHVRQFQESNNPLLNLFFEGTKPLSEIEAQVDEGIPLQKIVEKTENDSPSRLAALVQAADRLAENKKPIRAMSQEAEEARIKRMREQLEVKVG